MESIVNLANPLTAPKIKTALLLNTGGSEAQIKKIKAPLLIIHGGEEDVAVPAADENFQVIVDDMPELQAFKAVLETGHLGSFWSVPRGGIYAETALHWLDWHLKGQAKDKEWFEGEDDSPAAKRGWKVASNAI